MPKDVDAPPFGDGDAGPPGRAGEHDRSGIPVSIEPLHVAVKGRARLKVGGLRDAPSVGRLIERGLGPLAGVREVKASPLTGNVVVLYEPAWSLDGVIGHIAGLLRGDIAPPSDGPGEAAEWYAADPRHLAVQLATSAEHGLSGAEARARLAAAGPNALPAAPRRSSLAMLLGQFQSLPVALLGGATVVSLFTGGLLEAAAILSVVALNGVIGYQTESRAERTIRSLGAPEPMTAKVLRDGRAAEAPAESLVPGDVLLLERGMMVPADARLTSAQMLTVSEAALTGESLPVAKSVEPLLRGGVALADRINMVHRGTIVTGGRGTAIVVATGPHTELGRIQALIEATVAPSTPIEQQLDRLGRQLVWLSLAASGAILGVGWLRGLGLLQSVRSFLSVSVAAVPEGLPMVATTTLALGVSEMRRLGAHVRRLDAVEALATVNVVCFDKTGTLTHGSMSVDVLVAGTRAYRLVDGLFVDQAGEVEPPDDGRLAQLLAVGSLCSETELEWQDGELRLNGTATENALVQAALDSGLDVLAARQASPRVSILQRTEDQRFMTTTHARDGELFVAVKGSPAEVLARCSAETLPGGRSRTLTRARRSEIEQQNADLAEQGLRVLGIAFAVQSPATLEPVVDQLTWIGLAGLADPVRPGLRPLVEKLHRAGIRTVMVTGDQSATARTIAEQIGLSETEAVEVVDLAERPDATPAVLGAAARRAHAFARVSPGQKLQIVRSLQDSGALVAMIGDGVNDAPALRAANVGIAMGRHAASAARDVADVYLETDDLDTLLVAIERGRATYSNIRKSLRYLLSTNASEILLMLGGTAAGCREVLSPMQLLWINLVSDVLPGIGLAMEPPEPDLMDHPPPSPTEPIAGPAQYGPLGAEAATLAGGAFAAGLYAAMRHGWNSPQVRTDMFASLVTAQLVHALACRSPKRRRIDRRWLGSNPALLGIVGGSLALQSAALGLPALSRSLGNGRIDVLAVIAGGLLPFLANERRKPAGVALAGDPLRYRRRSAAEAPPVDAPEPRLIRRPAATAAGAGPGGAEPRLAPYASPPAAALRRPIPATAARPAGSRSR